MSSDSSCGSSSRQGQGESRIEGENKEWKQQEAEQLCDVIVMTCQAIVARNVTSGKLLELAGH